MHANNIYNNTQYGVSNSTSNVTINATFNWWGSPSGPYHVTTNPSGAGNEVTDYVDYGQYMVMPWSHLHLFLPLIVK